jgi:hypothetical protein
VVTNSRHVKASGGSITHPARTNQLRARVSSAVADPTVRMVLGGPATRRHHRL